MYNPRKFSFHAFTQRCVHRPKKNPLFLVDLILDQTGVHYSTPLENFATSVIDLLDKGILCTHNLPQLDKVTYTLLIRWDSE